MDILKAGPLTSRRAVRERFLFRLLWCFVGAVLALALSEDVRDQAGFLIGAVIAIASLGAIMDFYRLENPSVSVQRLYVIGAIVTGLALFVYLFISAPS